MLSPLYQDAVIYAMSLHKNQVRKGSGLPYITHLFSVSVTVLEYGGSETEAIAALLHDAAEDQGGLRTLRQIESKFGSSVANIVEECSDSLEENPTQKLPWKTRKQQYLSKIPHKSKSSLLVSVSDKLHNARSILRDLNTIGEEVFERFEGKKDGTLWYYHEIVSIFQQLANVHPILLQELEQTVSYLLNFNNRKT